MPRPDNLDLNSAGAGELAAAVRARATRALALCDAAIARIERLDGPVNAVIARFRARARAGDRLR